MYACTCIYVYKCVNVCLFTYAHAYMYRCIYVYKYAPLSGYILAPSVALSLFLVNQISFCVAGVSICM